MRSLTLFAALVLFALPPAAAQESPLPPAIAAPALVLDPGGPAAPVAAVAFAPDSSTLYVGGHDKLVRRYTLKGGAFAQPNPPDPIRVPLGPGNAGAVNAVAVSPDGKWVAVGGRAPFREEAWFGDSGAVTRSAVLSGEQKRDVGVVYLFDPANPGGGKVIRGAAGEVRAVAFARPTPAAGPVLVTAGLEWTADGKQAAAVRVFDVGTGKELASRTDLPVTPTLPGLAAWPVGKEAGAIKVAIAWPEAGLTPGRLRVWDVTANQTEDADDGVFNRSLALRAGADGAPLELWSGGFHGIRTPGQQGRLTVRPVGGLANGRPVAFPFDGKNHSLPRAVAAGGDTVATLLELSPGADPGTLTAELRLLTPEGKERSRLALDGLSRQSLPALSVSPDGKWVAVGGFADHRVEVYGTAANVTVQKLPGAAGGYAGVTFLAGDKLWVGTGGESIARGGLVFDFKQRQLTANGGNAAADGVTSAAANWKFDAEKTLLTVPGAKAPVTLRPGERPDAVALLPAGPAWAKDAAVVAVAHTDAANAVTLVSLFDATGRRLRQLVGPTQPVRMLAFSRTRPLLAAVGDDRTVSVWSLLDLPKAEGAVEGVFVTTRGDAVVVEAVDADSPAKGKLAAGDVITHVGGEAGNLKAVARAEEFRTELAGQPVGRTVRVQVRGKEILAVLPVGRGVGQRGPLFSLWFDPDAKAGPREWVGWSPAGPYDASSPETEARVGWLTTTGDPAQPTTFAAVGQYRKQYYKRGVLGRLAETGDLTAALAALPPPQAPTLTVAVAPTVKGASGADLIRESDVKLTVTLNDSDDVVLLEGATLRWRATGPDGKAGAWNPLPFPGRAATLDLGKHPWVRGSHTFEAALFDAVEKERPAATGAVSAAFVPPPPKVVAVRVDGKVVKAGDEITSEAAEVEISADAERGPGGAVVVSLTSSGPDGGTPQKLAAADGKPFGPAKAKLTEGSPTVIRVSAVTDQAGDFAKDESDAVEFRVRYTPKPPPEVPPRLQLKLTSPAEAPSAPGKPFVVDGRRVSLSAEILSDKDVAEVLWEGVGEPVKAAIEPGKAKAFTVTHDLDIPVDAKPRTLKVRARTATSEFGEAELSVVYAAVPAAEIAGLPPGVLGPDLVVGGPFSKAVAGAAVAVKVVVASPGLQQVRAFDAVLAPGKDDATAGTWHSDIHLFPGVNKLGLVVTTPWTTRQFLELADVAYRLPPVLTDVLPVTATHAGVGDVVARVVAARGSAPTRLVLNGTEAPTDPPRKLASAFGATWWEVRSTGVSVKTGGTIPDAVSVMVVNADGESRTVGAAVRKLPPPPAPLPPPVVVLDLSPHGEPGRPVHTTEPRLAFRLRVTSKARPSRVEVRYGPPTHAGHALPIDGVVGGPDGFWVEAKPELLLHEGVNQVRVTAASEAGDAAAEFTVSYTPPPVRVVIDRVDEIGPGGKGAPLPGPHTALAATGSVVEVRGRVLWTRDGDPIASDPSLEVVLTSNKVVHLPRPLDRQTGSVKERAFVAPAFLNAEKNAIRVEVRTGARPAGLPQQGPTVAELAVACQNPNKRQRLHVLVIGVEAPESERNKLVRNVVTAVRGAVPADRPGFDRGEFPHPAFARAVLYRPLMDNVDRRDIVGLLREVEREIRQTTGRPGEGWVNDLVVVYYQGKDLVGQDGVRRLHTTRSLMYAVGAADRFAVREDELPPTPGVRLVLLNVVGPDGSPADRLRADPLLVRYAWPTAAGLAQLLTLWQRATTEKSTLGGVLDHVRAVLEVMAAKSGPPSDRQVPQEVRAWRIGTGSP